MLRHLLKLAWHRKGANALIIAEIFFSFLVLFGVLAATVTFAGNWNRPIGFDPRNVWDVNLGYGFEMNEADRAARREMMKRILDEARSMPEVEAVASSTTPPYSFETNDGTWLINGRQVSLMFDDVTDEFAETLKLQVVRGRWFSEEDDALPYRAVVLDANAARALYGDDDPIGKWFDKQQSPAQMRVVGIVAAYRKQGEMAAPANMVFRRVSLTKPSGSVGRHLLLRLRPGTPAAFEEGLVARLQRVAPDVTLRVARMDAMRAAALRVYLTPVFIGGVLALFLISMVTLGLTGVLWQSVTRRTREIGLRRAMGATGPGVHKQILAEVALLTTFALIVGSVVVLQLPILGIFRFVPPSAFAIAFAGALATIYALTVLCGLYPSWLASRLQPADALRYE